MLITERDRLHEDVISIAELTGAWVSQPSVVLPVLRMDTSAALHGSLLKSLHLRGFLYGAKCHG